MRDRRSSVQRYRDVFAQRDLVRELEQLAERAYPPLTVLELDGWQLRASRGLTRRANSVWPRATGDRLGLERRLEAVERFYRQRRLDPAVAVSPAAQPAGLDRSLAERGWAVTVRRMVQTAPIDALSRVTGRAEVLVGRQPPQRWLEAWSELRGQPAAGPVFERVASPVAYVTVSDRGRVVGAARGVLDGGWLGVLDTAGGPETTFAAHLVQWAAAHGAERVYRDSDTALAGFRTAYEYRYRVRR